VANSPHLIELSVRFYQLLLHVCPTSFRKKYESEMTWVFREVVTDSLQRHGTAGLIATWHRATGDLAVSAFSEHLLELQGRWEMAISHGWIAKLLAILSVACFWVLPCSPILAIAAVSTTKGSSGWPRRLAVSGAILSTLCTLLGAALLLWLLFIRSLRGSWAF
jgi:hypothetical protein